MTKQLSSKDVSKMMEDFSFNTEDKGFSNYAKRMGNLSLNVADALQAKNDSMKFEIDRQGFHKDMERASVMTLKRIKENEPGLKYAKLEIRPVGEHGMHRSLEDQAHLEKHGSTATSLSLHNFGGAQDIGIFVDGMYYAADYKKINEKYNITGTNNLHEYFGGAIRDINKLEGKNYFWGWKHDSGHVAMTRFPDQLLSKYGIVSGPEMSKEELQNWYLSFEDSAPAKSQVLLTTLDSLYGRTSNREYLGNPGTRDDELLPGIVFNNLK